MYASEDIGAIGIIGAHKVEREVVEAGAGQEVRCGTVALILEGIAVAPFSEVGVSSYPSDSRATVPRFLSGADLQPLANGWSGWRD